MAEALQDPSVRMTPIHRTGAPSATDFAQGFLQLCVTHEPIAKLVAF